MNIDDDGDDDSQPLESHFKALKNGYSVHCDIDEFDSESIRIVNCSLKKDEEEVGSVEAYLIDRDESDNFYVDCDEISETLKTMSTTLFHTMGRLRRDMWPMFSEKEIQYSSSGGFLSIFMIKIDKEHRGQDLGFDCIKFLMDCVKGQWTLSVVELSYFHKSHKEKKKLQIYQLFTRFGYVPNQVKYLDYWFLIPKKLKQIPKTNGRNFQYPVLERIKPYVLNSHMDKLILSACLEQRFCKNKDGRLRKLLSSSIARGLDIDACGILIVAAGRRLPNLVQALLDEKANVNVKNEICETPLHAACRSGDVKCIELIMKQPGCQLDAKDRYNETAYDVFLFNLRTLFISEFVLESLNVSDKSGRISKYGICMALMPAETKKLLVEKVMSPRMFKRLNFTTTFYSDMAIDDLESIDFKDNQKISRSELLDISLMDCIPHEITKNGVYKGFAQGFVDILAVISVIMSHGEQLPTVNRILKLCQSKCHRSYKYFLENGGRITHILKGIIDCVADASWECGDNSEEEDDDQLLPKFKGLDGNFDFLKSYVLDYFIQN